MLDIQPRRAPRPAAHAAALLLLAALFALPGAVRAQGAKIAVVDLEFVVTNSPAGKALQQKLEKFQKDVQTQGEAMAAKGNEIRKRVAEGGSSLTPEQLTDLNRQMEDQASAIRRFRENKQKEGQKMQADGLREIETQLMPILEKFRTEGGYDLILNNVAGVVVMVDEKINVTQAILARLSAPK